MGLPSFTRSRISSTIALSVSRSALSSLAWIPLRRSNTTLRGARLLISTWKGENELKYSENVHKHTAPKSWDTLDTIYNFKCLECKNCYSISYVCDSINARCSKWLMYYDEPKSFTHLHSYNQVYISIVLLYFIIVSNYCITQNMLYK